MRRRRADAGITLSCQDINRYNALDLDEGLQEVSRTPFLPLLLRSHELTLSIPPIPVHRTSAGS